MNPKFTSAIALLLVAFAATCTAQSTTAGNYTDNFTDIGTTLSWTYINGACLTAGSATAVLPAGETAAPYCKDLPYYVANGDPMTGGDTGTLPDVPSSVVCPAGQTCGGALRFTGYFHENGAILSNFNFPLSASGLQVSFTTVTYGGNSGGSGLDGADGISFFLQDATYAADVGAFGGSLGYTCSNTNDDTTLRTSGVNRGYDGLAGGYVGLGIDEYGNFYNAGDNTHTGNGYSPGRIAMRGPGNINWASLYAAYPAQYPASLTNAQKSSAVQYACANAAFQDWSKVAAGTASSPSSFVPPGTTALPDYAGIAAKSFGVKIAVEGSATLRHTTVPAPGVVPITYNLEITTAGLLSLQYSYNGGAFQNVVTSQDVTQGGTYKLPANIRFGFAGSTGGSDNIHEIMCFSATPSNSSQSSAGLNQKQTAKVQQGAQVYFAFYNPLTLAGSLTSQNLVVQDPSQPNNLSISPIINWDASCVLTGTVETGCTQTAEAPGYPTASSQSRNILTWNPSGSTASGVPFQWGSLSSTQQAALDNEISGATPAPTADARLNYLRGDRSNEQTPSATSSVTYAGVYRDRTSVLGDIIDSSPTWVGPPNAPYSIVWSDLLDKTADTMLENSGQSYATYSGSGTGGFMTRNNVVYSGANDGMMHGFQSGSFDSSNTFQGATNNGNEVLAYVPAYIVNNIQTTTYASLNYSDPQYGHRFDVDAPPGTGDLYYGSSSTNGTWHTWLVGGLGPGGNAIYALDITDPSKFSEANASSLVIGEWSTQTSGSGATATVTSTTLTCANDSPSSTCGTHLGKTYGIPQIRRFHNGSWGAVFGNGSSSVGGDGGIYLMLVNPSVGPTSSGITFYYLSTSTGSTTTPNGIYYVTPADLDGDHITDYVYAGDLLGNVWRFDLTSVNASTWASTAPTKIYSTAGGTGSYPAQPITSKVVVASIAGPGNPHLLVEFGTGQQIPMTNIAAAQYATAQEDLYGIWDSNLTNWNSKSTAQYATLSTGAVLAGKSQLTQQSIGGPFTATSTGTGTDYRTITNNNVVFADQTGGTTYGWYIDLTYGNANAQDPADPQSGGTYAVNPTVYEQVIFSPILEQGAFIVNTTIPPSNSATACFSSLASGWTMALNPATGGSFTNSFFGDSNHNFLNVQVTTGSSTTTSPVSGLALSGTGSPSIVISGTQNYLVTQTVSGIGAIESINPPGGTKGSRLTWIERR